MKKALITGITGQDGSYLAEFLLEKGYDVHGVIRRSSVDYRERIAHLEGRPHFHLHYADLGDSMSIVGVVADVRPTEIYNLAAQSHVQVSFDSPEFTADVDAVTGPADHDGPRAGLIRLAIFAWVTSPLDRPRERHQPQQARRVVDPYRDR